MSGALLAIEGLTTEVLTLAGPRRLIEDVSFSIVAEEVLAIVGKSGSGKSVTMLSALGLLPEPVAITAGAVRFEGCDLLTLAERDLRRIRGDLIGMIFQEPMSALNPVTTVGAQVAETLVVHRDLSRKAAWAEAVRLLDRVRIPQAAERARLYPHHLSGGMRQRVVIAAAIACKPKLLIADEPTTALDATVQAGIMALLAELRRDIGCAVALITHDLGLVKDVADRIVVMNRGRVVEQGLQEEVFAAPRSAYTRTLLKAVFLSGAAEAGARQRRRLSSTSRMSPYRLACARPSFRRGAASGFTRSTASASPSRQARLLRWSAKAAAERLPLHGRSSGSRLLTRGESGSTAGTRGASMRRAARSSSSFRTRRRRSTPACRVWESAIEPLALAATERKTALRARAVGLLADVGLGADHLDRFPHELSGGQRQRIGIARALSVSPRILIADEAVSALDASTRLQVLDLLADLQRRTGVAILFITHDFGVVTRLAHRVAVMRVGRIVEIGRTAEVLNHPAHPYTKALLAAVPGSGELGKAGPNLSPGRHRSGRRGTLPAWPPLQSIGPDHAIVRE